MPRILVIVGPTSSGKSALAVELARTFDGEVISADSRQVYKDLDIGTGKITPREMKGIRHHLLDVASPKKVFTAHDFVEKARAAIEDIERRGKLPIIAGGTGFYIDALLGRIELPSVPENKALRRKLEKRSADDLFTLLKKKDPRRAKTIDPRNKRRLVRALEIVAALGKVPIDRHRMSVNALWLGLKPPFEILEKKILRRLSERLQKGMVGEAQRLRKNAVSLKRMRQLGLEYAALADLLEGRIDKKKLKERLRHEIRRYARRQLTYWKRNKDIKWFENSNIRRIQEYCKKSGFRI